MQGFRKALALVVAMAMAMAMSVGLGLIRRELNHVTWILRTNGVHEIPSPPEVETHSGVKEDISPSQEDWWQQYEDAVSVVYEPSNHTDWCPSTGRRSLRNSTHGRLEEQFPPVGIGMYFVKIPKAGSSTGAAVALQIAESVATEKGFVGLCPKHVRHGDAYKRRKSPSFLWTVVRQPHRRSISHYFFSQISRKGEPYNSTKLIEFLRRQKNFQMNYISKRIRTQSLPTLYNTSKATTEQADRLERMHGLFRSYDFIAVTERMDESLVVMKLLQGFKDESIIVFSSKRAGGFDDGLSGLCHKIKKSFTTKDVDRYLAGEFGKNNAQDYFLHAVANRSLDKTIDALGRERVEWEVARHRRLVELAKDSCRKKITLPCEKDLARPNPDSKRSCYFGDLGCGHECVMGVIRNTTA